MNPVILIFVVMIGAMVLMTRSARNKQRQATEMRSQMEPGTGVRTIGGLYAVVKEVNEETVLLELTDGVHAHFARNAIGAVLGEDEFNRIVHGIDPEGPGGIEEHADDAASGDAAATDHAPAADAAGGDRAGAKDDAAPIDLSKSDEAPEQDGSDAEGGPKGSGAK